MGYWDEQQLKQMGRMDQMQVSETKPDPKYGEPALETTLENVKKTLWDVQRHTHDTQSRLDVNNKSGPTFYAKKISRWADNDWILDMLSETLVEMQDTLENSSIARHSKSPLEESIAKLQNSTVSFNEKTLRWHDDQTNLMVKGSDPRVAKAMKPEPSAVEKATEDKMVTTKKTGLGVLAGFLKQIVEEHKKTRRLLGEGFFGKKKSAEDKAEGATAAKNEAKQEEKQTGFLQGMWENMKDKKKDSWLVENWGKILIAIGLLFTPLKHIVKLWDWIKTALTWSAKHPLIAAILALTAYFTGGAFLKAIGLLLLRKTGAGLTRIGTGASNLWQKARAGSHMTPAMKSMSKARALNAALPGPRVGKAVPLGRKVGMKMGSMAQSTKGIFGSIVQKFGAAGKWIMKLGSKLIMPLVTTPVGWAILAGLAIGGLVYAFWDEIKAGLKSALGMMTKAIDKVKSMFAGLDIMAGLRALVPQWILDMIGPAKPPEKVEHPSGEVTEKTDVSRREKKKADFKARTAAEDQGYIDQSFFTGGIKGLTKENKKRMVEDLNNGKLTRAMLVAMLDSGDLSKKKDDTGESDYGYVKKFLQHPNFKAPKIPAKAEVVTTDPGDISESGKEALSTYSKDRATASKIRIPRRKRKARKKATETLAEKLLDMPRPMQEALVAQMKPTIVTSLRQSKYKKDLADTGLWQFAIKKPTGDFDETEGQGPDMGRSARSIDADQAAFKKGGWAEVKKLRAAESPDDKMNTFNSIQKENLAAQNQPSSPVVMTAVDQSKTVAPFEQNLMMEDKLHNSDIPVGVNQ